ncbi:hypothetical protein [Streptomyces sp. fd1-xmd]|nr:hypothetical protein [Streptomyces sp. fd1-xmd]
MSGRRPHGRSLFPLFFQELTVADPAFVVTTVAVFAPTALTAREVTAL